MDALALMTDDEREAYLDTLSDLELRLIADRDWSMLARPEQLEPVGDWLAWFIKAGRGFGKTRSGGEWTMDRIKRLEAQGIDGVRWCLVAPTFGDVRDTMVEGESGLSKIIPPSMLLGGSWERSWNRSLAEINLENGHKIKGFSSEKPDRLRGPQHHGAWVDEPAYLKDASQGTADDTTWSNLLLGLRLPPDPRVVITGTPKRNALVTELCADPTIVVVNGSTYDNLANLSSQFKQRVVARYAGTRLGRQELNAELLEGIGEKFQWGWFNIADELPWRPTKTIRYWDLAATEPHEGNQDPDWTAGAKVAMNEQTRQYALLHIVRFRLNPGARNLKMRQVAEADGPDVNVYVEQGRGSDGKAVVAAIAKDLDGAARVRGDLVTGQKEDRADLAAGAAEQGRFWIVSGGTWDLTDFKDESEEFPNGRHDDMVDAVSGAMKMLGAGGNRTRSSSASGRSLPDRRPETARPTGVAAAQKRQPRRGTPAGLTIGGGGRPR